jgi:carnitine O-acetyltransferase
VLDNEDRPILSDKEIFTNLKAIVKDADTTPPQAVAATALGILTTESRKIWSHLRTELQKSNRNNANSLAVVESALFVVCLDDYEPEDVGDICGNFLCGSYRLEGGVQVGTCTNRWYDKVSSGPLRSCNIGEIAYISFKSSSAQTEKLVSTLSIPELTAIRFFATLPTSTPSWSCCTPKQSTPPPHHCLKPNFRLMPRGQRRNRKKAMKAISKHRQRSSSGGSRPS